MLPDTVANAIHMYLEQHIARGDWRFQLPHYGNSVDKCFFATSSSQTVVVRLGIDPLIVAQLAEAQITPRYLGGGVTPQGQLFFVQTFVHAHHPDEHWYCTNLSQLAALIAALQRLASLRTRLPPVVDETYQSLFTHYLSEIHQEFTQVGRAHADKPRMGVMIRDMEVRVARVQGAGLVPCHGDLNSGNILVTPDATYLSDWETLHLSDPLRDVAHLLWWMYPQSRWAPMFHHFAIDVADGNVKERFYLHVAMRALYIYLLFVNTAQEQLARRFLDDADRAMTYRTPATLLIR